MRSDEDVLTELNVRIGVAESEGDRAFLDGVLAPVLAFRRASGALIDRAAFLAAVATSAPRETEVTAVALHGRGRATVTCTVTLLDGDTPKRFHNLRLFVRDGGADAGWKLMAWANEPA